MTKRIFSCLMALTVACCIIFCGFNMVTYATAQEESDLNVEIESEDLETLYKEEGMTEADSEELERNGISQVLLVSLDAVADCDAELGFELPDYSKMIVAYVNPCLNIREEATSSSKLLGRMYPGSVATVIEKGETWSKVQSGDTVGYIKNSYVNFEDSPGIIAESGIESFSVAEPIKAPEAKDDQAEKGDKPLVNQDLSAQAPSKSEPEVQDEEDEEGDIQIYAATDANGNNIPIHGVYLSNVPLAKKACSASSDEAYLLACLVYCEAGNQSYEGQRAVANIVVNRVNSALFPNTITEVLYQPGQFRGKNDSAMASIAQSGPPQSCINAANEAINGVNTLGNYLFYCTNRVANTYKYPDNKVIGDHTFYNYSY